MPPAKSKSAKKAKNSQKMANNGQQMAKKSTAINEANAAQIASAANEAKEALNNVAPNAIAHVDIEEEEPSEVGPKSWIESWICQSSEHWLHNKNPVKFKFEGKFGGQSHGKMA